MNTEIRDLSSKEIETFISLWLSFESFVGRIIDYIPDILFPKGFWVGYSSYEINCDRLEITIKDSYHHSDTCSFSIPLDNIINNTWKEYIDDLEKKAIEQQEKTEKELREWKEKKEIENYQRLKEKFKDL